MRKKEIISLFLFIFLFLGIYLIYNDYYGETIDSSKFSMTQKYLESCKYNFSNFDSCVEEKFKYIESLNLSDCEFIFEDSRFIKSCQKSYFLVRVE